MNATCEWLQISAAPAARYAGEQFASAWVESLELRVAVFIMLLAVCIMTWVTTLVRSTLCSTTIVLHKLLASASAASGAPASHSARTAPAASYVSKVHKTDGGPPPGNPPS